MIHSHAIVDPSAIIADDVSIGPFCVIEAGVEIDSGTVIEPHVVIKGPTKIGKDNHIFQFASIGEQPQDLKYDGEPTRLEIGDRNRIREYVTMNRGTIDDKGVTSIGNDNLFMTSCHVAHDCRIGNNVILANAVALAGHVRIEDHAILGGYSTVHQFTRIGAHSFSGFATAIDRDVLPYFTIAGNRARAFGINKEGLKRRGFSTESIRALQETFKILVKSKCSHKEAVEKANELAKEHNDVKYLMDFLAASERGWVR
ncbi:MAG: acyl-ACP--UDP-N-acetylglucosamine O-acyltransferase [Gammaproteobacteria bacterium]|nr:acyl-ACP--UDP-N-acetylglucosamine O-acyltransferase [Gammaproteobacteria bacterium]